LYYATPEAQIIIAPYDKQTVALRQNTNS